MTTVGCYQLFKNALLMLGVGLSFKIRNILQGMPAEQTSRFRSVLGQDFVEICMNIHASFFRKNPYESFVRNGSFTCICTRDTKVISMFPLSVTNSILSVQSYSIKLPQFFSLT